MATMSPANLPWASSRVIRGVVFVFPIKRHKRDVDRRISLAVERAPRAIGFDLAVSFYLLVSSLRQCIQPNDIARSLISETGTRIAIARML